ncbi:MAG: DNA topoisomerase I [Candidatus Thorarchaeota archaeon]|nr:DNA topoisomerase I [Candidatus Thorarchaeota archaeon]
MESLVHRGIIVLEPPESKGFHITVHGQKKALTRLQEEMAIAWVRKLGTPYVEDPIFCENFMTDFSKALETTSPLSVDEIDFSEIIEFVEQERATKEAMTKEEKKAQREARKVERERLKEEYGYAIVDGERMELGSYQTEPSGIFMGRGEHPLRGRWKKGVTHKDITLNLSPDAPVPEGDWDEIVWASDSMWIAKWVDELTGKVKYLWLHDSSPIKQEREAEKYDKAMKVAKKIDAIRAHIMEGIHSEDYKTRMVAAACYLIDALSLRVGDEKDPDEADTVGATTLRAEHLTFKKNSVVFNFLGKDSVPWHKELEMPLDVYNVFRELYERTEERIASFKSRKGKTKIDPKKPAQLFPRINSSHVNRFLGKVDKNLTAKVFRTFHATLTMQDELRKSKTKQADPDFIKKAAVKRANLEVARIMNHTKQAPKGWSRTADRYVDRIKKAEQRITKTKAKLQEQKKKLRARKKKEKQMQEKKQSSLAKKKKTMDQNWQVVLSWREKRNRAKTTWDNARERKRRTRTSKRKAKTTKKERLEEAQTSIERTRARLDDAETGLSRTRDRYTKSKTSLEKQQQVLADFKEKSTERIAQAEKALERMKEQVRKAEIAKSRIETDFALAKASRTWNLGTSLKSYIHPKVVYTWCKKVDYDWKRVYPRTLQRKFAWVEN